MEVFLSFVFGDVTFVERSARVFDDLEQTKD